MLPRLQLGQLDPVENGQAEPPVERRDSAPETLGGALVVAASVSESGGHLPRCARLTGDEAS
jgi:hypothetical protein